MQQTIKGEVKLPRDIDQSTKDLLLAIFQVDPNLRINIEQMKEKHFFSEVDWDMIKRGQMDMSPPFSANANKYKYILFNTYPVISNMNDQNSNNVFISSDTPQKSKVLGDFTLQKINREFADF